MTISYIDDSLLTDIADSIRAKNGESSQYTPAQMSDAIDALPTGGGGIDYYAEEAAGRDYAYSNSDMTTVPQYLFYQKSHLVGISLPNITRIENGAFYGTHITSISFPLLTYIATNGFYNCSYLKSANLPELTGSASYIFYGCSRLETVNAPKLGVISGSAFSYCASLKAPPSDILTMLNSSSFNNCTSLTEFLNRRFCAIGQNAFYNCRALGRVRVWNSCSIKPKDLSSRAVVTSIANNAFYNCSNLTALILDEPDPADADEYLKSLADIYEFDSIESYDIVNLASTVAFRGTPIESGTGYIYVPDSLVDSYKAATNWTTYAAQIKPLSELPSE